MSTLPDWLIAVIALVYPQIEAPPPHSYNGYIEGDYVYAAAASSGRITDISVTEGAAVTEGTVLFRLDATQQEAALRAAQAQVAQAQAVLDNLLTGSREAETEVIRAELARAETELDLAQSRLERTRQLFDRGSVAQARVDDDQAATDSAAARVAELRAQLAVAELPARAAQVVAAEAALDAARAEADRARSALDDQVVLSPHGGLIDRVFFDNGEVAGAGTPVVAILPPDGLTALFFIPQDDRSSYRPGDEMAVSCDGCQPGLTATITRLASTPQYTPPIIYSSQERARLVFRAEADLTTGSGLLPGQPITVRPLP